MFSNLPDADIYDGLTTLGYVSEGDYVPLLPAMLAGAAEDQCEGSAIPAEPQHTPTNPDFNTGNEDCNTSNEDFNTGSLDVSQRERKAPMTTEEIQAIKRTKGQIQQEEVGLVKAMRLQSLQEEEAARQVHFGCFAS
ncbi:hypothetical protein Tco_0435004 [Tanacetum coccineum]